MKRTYAERTERLARVETLARRYARSGQHLNFRTIEALLLNEGYPEARKVFANPWTQSELNRLCQLSLDRTENQARFLALAHAQQA
jgi:hypothetical protein